MAGTSIFAGGSRQGRWDRHPHTKKEWTIDDGVQFHPSSRSSVRRCTMHRGPAGVANAHCRAEIVEFEGPMRGRMAIRRCEGLPISTEQVLRRGSSGVLSPSAVRPARGNQACPTPNESPMLLIRRKMNCGLPYGCAVHFSTTLLLLWKHEVNAGSCF